MCDLRDCGLRNKRSVSKCTTISALSDQIMSALFWSSFSCLFIACFAIFNWVKIYWICVSGRHLTLNAQFLPKLVIWSSNANNGKIWSSCIFFLGLIFSYFHGQCNGRYGHHLYQMFVPDPSFPYCSPAWVVGNCSRLLWRAGDPLFFRLLSSSHYSLELLYRDTFLFQLN